MRTTRTVVLAMLAAALAAAVAVLGQGALGAGLASPWVELNSARVRLVAGGSLDKAAGSYLAGVEIALAEGWKTYWRTPGDAGVPPAFDWAGSVNVASVKVRYPAPTRLPEPAAETIGYKGVVLFPVDVVPQDARKPVALKLALSLGICREICIPAEASLDLALAPSQRAGDTPPALAAALERVPRPQASRRAGDPKLERVTASLEGDRPHLAIEASFPQGGRGADVFVEALDGLYVPQPKRLAGGATGTLRFEVDLSRGDNARELRGKTLTLTLVDEAGATEVTWTVP
jgi:DsbC/DsbD-like thiol-disulfide interchange protein